MKLTLLIFPQLGEEDISMKNLKKLLFALGTASILVTGGAMTALAETNITAESELANTPICVYGTAQKLANDRLHLTNSSTNTINDIVVTTKDALILDAVSGMPVSYEDIKEGSSVYAYVGPAMTLSLPPMANADIVLVNIPADYKVPSYVIVKSLDMHEDGSAALTANDGQVYNIPADCNVIPYLTRQMLYVNSLTPGSACLIWTDSDSNTANRVMRFNSNPSDHSEASDSAQNTETLQQTGWSNQAGNWYYYNSEGQLHRGWLELSGDWYYLNPDNGVMATGFIQVDGKTYYMLSDGKMLTQPMTFTPDASGALK
jgi:hypothetical protein